jgi:hypothetical protein
VGKKNQSEQVNQVQISIAGITTPRSVALTWAILSNNYYNLYEDITTSLFVVKVLIVSDMRKRDYLGSAQYAQYVRAAGIGVYMNER